MMPNLSPQALRRVVDRQDGLCPRCGQPLGDDAHVATIRPIGKGGTVDAGNLVATHRLCSIEPDLAHTSPVPGCGCRFCGAAPLTSR